MISKKNSALTRSLTIEAFGFLSRLYNIYTQLMFDILGKFNHLQVQFYLKKDAFLRWEIGKQPFLWHPHQTPIY